MKAFFLEQKNGFGWSQFWLFQSTNAFFACNKYHSGFRSQVETWPTNPLDIMITQLNSPGSSKDWIVADMGCGEARLSASVPQKVHSFDLVAANDRVVACDVKNVSWQKKKLGGGKKITSDGETGVVLFFLLRICFSPFSFLWLSLTFSYFPCFYLFFLFLFFFAKFPTPLFFYIGPPSQRARGRRRLLPRIDGNKFYGFPNL